MLLSSFPFCCSLSIPLVVSFIRRHVAHNSFSFPLFKHNVVAKLSQLLCMSFRLSIQSHLLLHFFFARECRFFSISSWRLLLSRRFLLQDGTFISVRQLFAHFSRFLLLPLSLSIFFFFLFWGRNGFCTYYTV